MNKQQSRKTILCLLLILAILVSACACRGETIPPVSKRESVADVMLEIRDGILYVKLSNGETYRTMIAADDISVLRPEIGTGQGGSMVCATILKDGKEVAYLNQSYVAEFMTKGDVAAYLGSLTKVSPDAVSDTMITILVIATSAVVLFAVVFVKKKIKKPARS